MTWALVSLSILLVLLLTSTGVWLHAEVSEGKHVRDRLEQEQQVSQEYRHQRDEAKAELAVTKDQLEQERNLREAVEKQRNDAWRTAREHTAEQILASDLDDAVAVGNRILSTPLPGLRLSESGDSALEKP